MKTALTIATVALGLVWLVPTAEARNCWWNGYDWQCRPSYHDYRWQDEGRRKREWERWHGHEEHPYWWDRR